jgi:hypothetical protein
LSVFKKGLDRRGRQVLDDLIALIHDIRQVFPAGNTTPTPPG